MPGYFQTTITHWAPCYWCPALATKSKTSNHTQGVVSTLRSYRTVFETDAVSAWSKCQKQCQSSACKKSKRPVVSQSHDNCGWRYQASTDGNLRFHGKLSGSVLDTYLPSDGRKVKAHLENLVFPYPITLMTYSFDDFIGNVYFLWCTKEWWDDGELQAVNYVINNLSTFSTWDMCRGFLDKYVNVAKPHTLRNMWRELIMDCAAPEYAEQAEIDKVLQII